MGRLGQGAAAHCLGKNMKKIIQQLPSKVQGLSSLYLRKEAWPGEFMMNKNGMRMHRCYLQYL